MLLSFFIQPQLVQYPQIINLFLIYAAEEKKCLYKRLKIMKIKGRINNTLHLKSERAFLRCKYIR